MLALGRARQRADGGEADVGVAVFQRAGVDDVVRRPGGVGTHLPEVLHRELPHRRRLIRAEQADEGFADVALGAGPNDHRADQIPPQRHRLGAPVRAAQRVIEPAADLRCQLRILGA